MRAAAAVLVAASLALAGCSGDTAEPVAAPSTTTQPGTPAATPSARPADEPTQARPVYWLRDLPATGPRLYREFVSRPPTDDPVRDALEVMLDGSPLDPDYTSLWPEGTRVLSVVRDGDLATVDLSGQALAGGAGSLYEAVSVQQLLYTVTAADPEVRRVQLTVEGRAPQTLWGHVATARPLTRGPAVENLAPVWVLEPVEGGTIPASGSVSGTASVFEATVSWEWLRDGEVVASGFSTATEGAPGRGEWSAAVEVPPGEYVFRAFEESAEDGEATFVDDKRVAVVDG